MLIVLSGLPGVGKTTIAQDLVRMCSASYLRIDTIEQALLSTRAVGSDLGAVGYVVAYELARANLRLQRTVVVDAVNPLTAIRQAWREVAASAYADIIEVEVVCSDTSEHQRRVQCRQADIPGHILPTWDDVQRRDYEPWKSARLVIDSAQLTSKFAALQIFDVFQDKQKRPTPVINDSGLCG